MVRRDWRVEYGKMSKFYWNRRRREGEERVGREVQLYQGEARRLHGQVKREPHPQATSRREYRSHTEANLSQISMQISDFSFQKQSITYQSCPFFLLFLNLTSI